MAYEKTEWANTLIIFLGILLDGVNLVLSIPLEKQEKALRLIRDTISKKKVTVRYLQVLTGYLNFLTKAIFAGRTFTRCMYATITAAQNRRHLKPFHHIRLDSEFKLDCEIWKVFLEQYRDIALCRPMVDLNVFASSHDLRFTSDASANETLGAEAVFNGTGGTYNWSPTSLNKKE